jgi:hypothetical protein
MAPHWERLRLLSRHLFSGLPNWNTANIQAFAFASSTHVVPPFIIEAFAITFEQQPKLFRKLINHSMLSVGVPTITPRRFITHLPIPPFGSQKPLLQQQKEKSKCNKKLKKKREDCGRHRHSEKIKTYRRKQLSLHKAFSDMALELLCSAVTIAPYIKKPEIVFR